MAILADSIWSALASTTAQHCIFRAVYVDTLGLSIAEESIFLRRASVPLYSHSWNAFMDWPLSRTGLLLRADMGFLQPAGIYSLSPPPSLYLNWLYYPPSLPSLTLAARKCSLMISTDFWSECVQKPRNGNHHVCRLHTCSHELRVIMLHDILNLDFFSHANLAQPRSLTLFINLEATSYRNTWRSLIHLSTSLYSIQPSQFFFPMYISNCWICTYICVAFCTK